MAKKSFTEAIQRKATANPTMQFISQPEPERVPPEPVEKKAPGKPRPTPPAHRANPQYEETKNRRLQLLITPSLQDALRKKAAEERTSVNDLINTLLKQALKVR